MAEITASLVKQLREMTGAGMMECKKALNACDGDIDAAVDELRKRGLAAAAKKAGRATNEGRVNALLAEGNAKIGAVCQVNCETDFVSINDKFQAYAETFTRAVIENNPATVEDLLASDFQGEKVQDALTEAIHVIGENMQISNFKRLEVEGTGALVPYIHMNGKIGVLVSFAFNNEATAADERFITCGKDVAMQIAALNPVSVDSASVPESIREHEMSIYVAQAAESGKPEAIQQKIAEGRMHKFYKESCLLEQDFVKDGDMTVEQYVAKCSKELGDELKVVDFARIQLGE